MQPSTPAYVPKISKLIHTQIHFKPTRLLKTYAATLPRLPTANATQPAIKAVPPNGVTGPKNFHLCGSNTNK